MADAPRSLEVGGNAVLLDEMGPMVVGADGSLSRIANWGEMTEREREVAARRIVKRNRERLAELRSAQPATECDDAAPSDKPQLSLPPADSST